jgi:hypothetical protein
MATTAQYTAQPIVECTTLSSAATSTIAAALATSAANGVGKRILRVYGVVTATNAAGKISLYIGVSGTNYLIAERAIAANTVSSTSAALRVEFPEATGLVLPGTCGNTYALVINNGAGVTLAATVESGLL